MSSLDLLIRTSMHIRQIDRDPRLSEEAKRALTADLRKANGAARDSAEMAHKSALAAQASQTGSATTDGESEGRTGSPSGASAPKAAAGLEPGRLVNRLA